MKNFVAISILFLFIVSCKNKQQKINVNTQMDTANFTTIKWVDTLFTFDSIKQGDKISFKYKCINTGNKPLVLTEVRPGCGCTVADFSKEAILPNKEGWVTASFDSKRFCDQVNKSILVVSNTSNEKERVLKFTGFITNCESNDRVVLPKENK